MKSQELIDSGLITTRTKASGLGYLLRDQKLVNEAIKIVTKEGYPLNQYDAKYRPEEALAQSFSIWQNDPVKFAAEHPTLAKNFSW